MLRRLFVFVVCLMAAITTASAQTPPYNEIWYTTTDGRPLFINRGYKKSVGLYMYSDTYNNGRGVLKFESGGYINFITEGLLDGNDRLKSITIPSSVTSIGESAFSGCSSLTSITIPNSVTEIGYEAFRGCSSIKSFKGKFASSDGRCLIKEGELIAFAPAGLTSYTISESVTEIGGGAFSGCSSLTSVKVSNKYCYDYFKDMVADITFYGANASADGRCLIINGKLEIFIAKGVTEYTIPSSVTSIGESAFSGCSSLTSINIPNSVTSIGKCAFYNCSSLTSITIPDSVTEIGSWAFYRCYSLTSITIPNSVTSIGEYAFCGCSSLISITIPNSVKSIGNSAFNRCSNLTSITIPESVTSIGEEAFEDCSSLTSITIPNSVTSIGYEAFRGCSSLKSITIPNSVTSIGHYAFMRCSSLKSITIGNSVTWINSNVFEGCSRLKSVKVANKYCYDYFKDKIANIAFYGANASDDGRCLIIGGKLERFSAKGITEYTIPESIKSIGEEAFSGCNSLTSVKVSNKYCYDYFKDRVADITFYGANASADGRCLIVNGELQRFIGKGITEYTIPESVTSIGEETFRDCSSLTSITCLATTPPAIDDLSIAETTMIYVPKKGVKAYKKDPNWSIYKKQIKPIK